MYNRDVEADCPKLSLGFDETFETEVSIPICTQSFHPQKVFDEIESIYLDWHRKRGTRPVERIRPKLFDSTGKVVNGYG